MPRYGTLAVSAVLTLALALVLLSAPAALPTALLARVCAALATVLVVPDVLFATRCAAPVALLKFAGDEKLPLPEALLPAALTLPDPLAEPFGRVVEPTRLSALVEDDCAVPLTAFADLLTALSPFAVVPVTALPRGAPLALPLRLAVPAAPELEAFAAPLVAPLTKGVGVPVACVGKLAAPLP